MFVRIAFDGVARVHEHCRVRLEDQAPPAGSRVWVGPTAFARGQGITPEMLGPEEARRLTAGIPVASIGPVTVERAKALGIITSVMPTEYTIPALVQALVEYFKRSDQHSAFDGQP